jgi:HEAT repeat protein
MENSGTSMKKFITSAALLFLAVLLLTAGQSGAQDTAVSEVVKEQIEMLQSGSAKQKIIAARNLGGMGAEALPSVQYLIELLDSTERHKSLLKKILNVVTVFGNFGPYISDECRESLTRIGKPAVIPLSDALLNHPRFGVRRSVAVALGEIADVESVDSLIVALRTDADYEVRSCSAEALGKMSERWLIDLLGNAVQALIEALKSEDPDVRQKAAYALGELEAQEAVPSLIELLHSYGKESDAGQALKKITGQRLGDDPQKWLDWWAKNKPE